MFNRSNRRSIHRTKNKTFDLLSTLPYEVDTPDLFDALFTFLGYHLSAKTLKLDRVKTYTNQLKENCLSYIK